MKRSFVVCLYLLLCCATAWGNNSIKTINTPTWGYDFVETKKIAEHGNPEAQYQLSRFYGVGKVVTKDEMKAVYWAEKAAKQGHAGAHGLLGWHYYYGEGVPRDPLKALGYYLVAANKGDEITKNNLEVGLFSLFVQSVDGALSLVEQYAEQNNTLAAFYLAKTYYHGQLGEPNYEKALYWYEKAANNGDPTSQFDLGNMYFDGKGTEKDYKKGFEWMLKAAMSGQADAQFNVAVCYNKGDGAIQDYDQALMWAFVASASQNDNNGGAKNLRDHLKNGLPSDQIANAQRKAYQLQAEIDRNEFNSASESSLTDKHDKKTPTKRQDSSASKQKDEAKGSGTGFFITADGYILTCNHVIEGSASIEAWIGENKYKASLICVDKNNDLAILKIAGNYSALSFSSRPCAQLGQEVFTIGYPNPILQGMSEKFTDGAISSLTGYQDDPRLYQVSVPIQPGNSGGPLIDKNGNVVGIIVSILNAANAFKVTGSIPQNVNYAIKSIYAQALISTKSELAGNRLQEFREGSAIDVVARCKESVVLVVAY